MELRNNRKIIFIIVAVVIIIFVKILPLFDTDKDKIKRLIYSVKAAIEEENILKCISYISLNYSDKDGNNRANLFLIGKNVFQTYDDIFIIVEELRIDITSQTKAVAHILASGQTKKTTGEKFPYNLCREKVRLDVIFQKENASWKVLELEFIDPEGFWQLLKGSL